MTTRTAPPTRRSTSASLVCQPSSTRHQRRITSSLVHASNTAVAGAGNVRSMRRALVSLTSRAVRVVVVPPPVRGCLRVAVRRVLPLLLPSERRDVEIAPGAPQRLVAAVVDEVGAVDRLAVADEGVVSVPLV